MKNYNIKLFTLISSVLVINVIAGQQDFFPSFAYNGVGGGWDRAYDFEYQEYADCGFNMTMDESLEMDETDLALAHAKGLKVMPIWTEDWKYDWDECITNELDARAQEMVDLYATNPAMHAYFLFDEPDTSDFSGLAYAKQKLHELDSNHVAAVSLLGDEGSPPSWGAPTFDSYLQQFMDQVQPEVLFCGSYNPDSWGHHGNLEIIRSTAIQYDIPFWSIYHACDAWGINTHSAGQIRFHVYSALAYGTKGLCAFMYYSIPAHANNAILNNDNSKNQLYYYQQAISSEIKTLSKTLIKCTSTAVYHTPTSIPNRGRGIQAGDLVTAVSGGNALMGEFTNDVGAIYLMLVNNDFSNGKTITFTFDNSVTGLQKIDKLSGKLITCNMSGHTLAISFTPGNGELIKVIR